MDAEFWQDEKFLGWYRKMIIRERILEETSAWLLRLTATDKFLHMLGFSLTLSFGASHVAVLLYDRDKGDYRVRMSSGSSKIPAALVRLEASSFLVQELNYQEQKSEISEKAQHDLKRLGADLCFPIRAHDHLIGVLAIGPRRDRRSYEAGSIPFFHTLANDIGAELEKESYYNASITDPLTGLYNRTYLNEVATLFSSRGRHLKGRIAVALVDVDHFKKINDTYGHLAGDHVLKVVAQMIRHSVRASDRCVRYGGEEFCILFSDFKRRDGSTLAADGTEFSDSIQRRLERLRADISAWCIPWEETSIKVTVSVGISFLNLHTRAWQTDQIIEAADEMLYEAKRSGRNRVLSHFHKDRN